MSAGPVSRALGLPLRGLIWLYQTLISPFLGSNGRYMPTCSSYAEEAIRVHGGVKGSWLTLKRLARCHPWGGSGYDPVPLPREQDEHHDAA